jgi:competence protein ComEA
VRARLRALAAGEHPVPAGPDHGPAPDPATVDRAIAAERRRRGGSMVLALVLAGGAGWFLLQVLRGPDPAPLQVVPGDPPAPTAVVPVPDGTGTPRPALGGSGGPEPALLVVHVLGEVRRPGLVRLPEGARVADALSAAGGLVPGGGSGQLNLARPLVDGEQVVVSADAGPDPPAGSSGQSGGGPGPGAVDLNSATLADLDTLPGVGPVLAGRILAWREANGRFGAVDQLGEVPGIGERTLERLAPLVRV